MTPVSFSAAVMGRGTATAADCADRDAIAKAFVDARRAGVSLPDYPGNPPVDLAQAYAIQDAALALWDAPLGGWKVGRVNPPLDEQLGANRLAGPVMAANVVEADGAGTSMAVFAGGFAAGEAEFMLRLAPRGSLAPAPFDDEAVLALIDDVRIGIEIAASPYPGINSDGPCVTISDHGNNAGLVLGTQVPKARWSKLQDIEIEAFVDGHPVGAASARTMLDGPLGAVRFLLANLAERGIVPEPGWWISTGAVTGVHPLNPGQTFSATFDGLGQIACRVEERNT